MKKNNLSFILTTFVFFLSSSIAFSQTLVTTQMKSYKMCRIDKTDVSEFDCREEVGQLFYSKITVSPNRYITTYYKEKNGEDESVKAIWDFSNLEMNNDKTLFIYNFAKTNINKPGGSSLTIVMRLDYTVQAVIYMLNYEGDITKFTMFDK